MTTLKLLSSNIKFGIIIIELGNDKYDDVATISVTESKFAETSLLIHHVRSYDYLIIDDDRRPIFNNALSYSSDPNMTIAIRYVLILLQYSDTIIEKLTSENGMKS